MNARSAKGVVVWRRFTGDANTEIATMRLDWCMVVAMGKKYVVIHRPRSGSATFEVGSGPANMEARPNSGPKAMEAKPWKM